MERLVALFEDLHGLPVPFIDSTLIYIRSYLGFEEREIKVAIHKTMPDIEEMLENLAIQKAWAEGRNEGRVESLLRLIERKFGAPSNERRERIARASSDEIDRWFDRLLDASNLEELFGDSEE